MNRRGIFRLLAGASAAALGLRFAEARPDYTRGRLYTFHLASHNAGPVSLKINNNPRREITFDCDDLEAGSVISITACDDGGYNYTIERPDGGFVIGFRQFVR